MIAREDEWADTVYSLTLALMGSDDLNLRVLSTSSDDPRERRAASKVLRLLARGRHWVLVVLLLGNVVSDVSPRLA
jgi:metal transporter CNNM